MKNTLYITLLLFISQSVFAQTTKELFNPEYRPGTVVLFGDNKMTGFIMLKDNSDIKFKQSIDSKDKKTYYSRSIKSLIFEDAIFEYKTVINKSSKEKKALKVEIDGEVTLFSDSFIRNINSGVTGTGVGVRGSGKEPEIHYYLGEKNSPDVFYLGFPNSYSKKFILKTESYFGSCLTLLKKIRNREFERFDIIGIVNFYNNECNKTKIDE